MKRWILTYYQATQILHVWGERAWPWNVPIVWRLARKDVDVVIAERKNQRERHLP